MNGLRVLVRSRLALLGLLGSAGWWVVAGLAVAELVVVLLPAATAVATGWLIGRVVEIVDGGGGLGPAVVPLTLVGVLLVLDLVGQSVLEPLRDWVSMRVNGRVRRRVRLAVTAPPGIGHLEDQAVRDSAILPVFDRYFYNLGAGAEGQLWLLLRFVGATVSAALLATYSLGLALFVFTVLAVQRAILRRQYITNRNEPVEALRGAARASAYWQRVGGTGVGAKEVGLFGFGDWAVGEFAASAGEITAARNRLFVRVLPKQWLTFLLSAAAATVPFVVLTRAALDGELSTAQFSVMLGAVVALFPLGSMGWEAYAIEDAVAQVDALDRLDKLCAVPAATSAAAAAVAEVPTIRFERVSFRYPGGAAEVLHEFELEIAPGQSLAIVGENGAGKSTLIKLLAGFYQPTAGRILIDGTDLRELDPAAWRRRLAVIFQDFVHFELSALDNVALAALDRPGTAADAQAAAEAAGAMPVIDALPARWQTVLSRGYGDGAELSGGQWQRIALARALYAARTGAGVLVLDEPTANLDVLAETALFDQLLSHARGLTAIVISHRFSTVRRAERIVVIGHGRVIEDGSHDSLNELGGVYARLYRLQAAKFVAGEPT